MRPLVWFRRDLRVEDNPALHRACQLSRQVTALYINCPEQDKQHNQSEIQTGFIAHNLNALGRELAVLGIPLLVYQCRDYSEAAEQVVKLQQQQRFTHLFANLELGINEQRRDEAVRSKLPVPFELSNGDCVIDHGTLRTGSGSMYKVFTPFSRAWLATLQRTGFSCLDKPKPQAAALPVPKIPWLDQCDSLTDWPAGEQQAQRRLISFCRNNLRAYGEYRDHPALDSTSALSPYLAIGVISPNQCLRAIQNELGYLPISKGELGFSWLNELIWREFYRHLMGSFPRLSMHRAFKPETENLPWRNDREAFETWCRGETGFPIVDAAMRCLNETGWMHNRLRMIVASFLTKDLHIHWQWGEAYFMSRLIDGDLAANNGGWQWAAGTGADAAPYFRVFNPTTQGKRFDAGGEFIRRWLPELADVPEKKLHEPAQWLAENNQSDRYPAPIVDHAEAREKAIAMFEAG